MSTLYLGSDQDGLAAGLATLLEEGMRQGDFFAPVTVVVPNRYLGKWLRLWLARRLGIAINLDFVYLEEQLWAMLRELDPRDHKPELLDPGLARLLILADILEHRPADQLQEYLPGKERRHRAYYRRAWHLAGKLAGHLRDYSFHRQQEFIQPWLKQRNGRAHETSGDALERSQRELYQRLVEPESG